MLITQNNKLIAKLVPFDKSKKGTNQHIRVGSAKGLIEISDDFDEPLDDLNYMK